ncbi:MAG: sulfatase [Verrucomicrobiae bacterium]|nr:sulfatase [Verrucomicrobiae bacterium]
MMRYLTSVVLGLACGALSAAAPAPRPNILVAISDDQSWAHASAYGCKAVRTPAFDRVARDGVLFKNAFGASPGCSPCRAALLTGRHTWMIEEAGTHASSFPAKYVTYPDLLEKDGYFVGYTGKGWGPGDWKISGRGRNPAGTEFSGMKNKPPHKGINQNDYAGNFSEFLKARPAGKPFCFWYGATEPHRGYEKGSGAKAGKALADVSVPPFLPDASEIRSDILDYLVEIEWFDAHLGRMLEALEKSGELQNTLVIVTSDNGMPFPRAKANCYEYGIHMPLAICWGARVPGGRVVEDLVGFVDLTATILEAAGVNHPSREFPLVGRSLLALLTSGRQGAIEPGRDAVFAARERHSSSRYNNWTYPQRAIRTPRFLYVRNFRPDRWPAGDPVVLSEDKKGGGSPGTPHSGYKDIDGSPSLEFLIAGADDPRVRPFLDLAVAKRPAEELFDIREDPGCLKNLADDPGFAATRAELAGRLERGLRETGDPRILDGGEIWESYPRYSPIREFPEPKESP